MFGWLGKILYAVDELGNAITGGEPDETISSRMGRCLQDPHCGGIGKWTSRSLCGLLNFVNKDHCLNAIKKAEVKKAMR